MRGEAAEFFAGAFERALEAALEAFRRKFRGDGSLGFAAHAGGERGIVEQQAGEAGEFGGIVGEEAAEGVLDGRAGMAIAENGEAGGHGFEGGHVVTVFEARVGGVNVEAMTAENFFEALPIARGGDAGEFVVAADESDGQGGEGALVKFPEENVFFARDVVGDAQAGGEIAAVGKIIAGVGGEGDDVIVEAPGFSFEVRYGHDVRADQFDVLMDGGAKFGGRRAAGLFESDAVERGVNDEEARGEDGFGVEKIAEVVGDDAIVGGGRGESFREADDAGVGGDGAHGFVPAVGVAAGKADDDVHGLIEDAQLVDPGFVAIEDEKARIFGGVRHGGCAARV